MQSAFRPHPSVLNHPSARVRRLALGTEREAAALQRQAEALEFDLPFEDADINGNHRAAPYRERHGLRSLRVGGTDRLGLSRERAKKNLGLWFQRWRRQS